MTWMNFTALFLGTLVEMNVTNLCVVSINYRLSYLCALAKIIVPLTPAGLLIYHKN